MFQNTEGTQAKSLSCNKWCLQKEKQRKNKKKQNEQTLKNNHQLVNIDLTQDFYQMKRMFEG